MGFDTGTTSAFRQWRRSISRLPVACSRCNDATLGQLMRDSVAARLVVAPEKLADSSKALGLPELYGTLQKSIWSELGSGASISMMRRNLQREHVRLLAEAVSKPSPAAPARCTQPAPRGSPSICWRNCARPPPSRACRSRTAPIRNESIALLDGALKAQIAKVIG